jgi:acyl carrier protein phosphodiesterase
VNFYAHLWVARRRAREPAFLLGAMLPDFATMCGARLTRAAHVELASGIEEHHRTDDAFHAGATFLALCRDTGARLEEAGLGWGAARAVAHVGTELLLDGELATEGEGAADYLLAIEEAAAHRSGPHLPFRDETGHARFRDLHARLSRHGMPVRYREPDFVAEVLVRLQVEVRAARGGLIGETLEALARAEASGAADQEPSTR